ncbi:MAG: hypothetical protein JJ843_06830 [Prochlorococcus marinus CUG1434]|nr:hypothetical protein [Prochlorococcus marinus CUG1434]
MIEENKNINEDRIDAYPIPQEAVILDDKKVLDLSQVVMLAIKQIIKDRGISLKIKKKGKNTDEDCVFEINNFSIQVVYTGITSDHIIVPLKRWYKLNDSPQIILAASIDEENNIIFFNGIITAKEFINIFLERNAKNQTFEISLNQFKGGINRLLSFVEILDSKALSKSGLTSKLNSHDSLLKKIGFSRRNISIGALVLGSIIFGPAILKPRISYNLASIKLSEVEILSNTRGNDVNNIYPKLCILSPYLSPSKNNKIQVSNIFFDKPIIYTPDPLNEIIISKNGKVIWSKKGLSINERILGPINWPIDPLKPNEEYILSLRPKGIPSGEFGNILISASPELIRFDDLVDSLGENKNKWIKTINKMFKEDKNLAFALLLSNKLPESNILNEYKNKFISIEGCVK